MKEKHTHLDQHTASEAEPEEVRTECEVVTFDFLLLAPVTVKDVKRLSSCRQSQDSFRNKVSGGARFTKGLPPGSRAGDHRA